MNDQTTIQPVSMDASLFLESHKSLGDLYEPVMGGFVFFSILMPIWLVYLAICSILSLGHYLIRKGTLKEYQPTLKNTCTLIQPYYQYFYLIMRTIIDGILNPTTLVLYPYILQYLFLDTEVYQQLVYINNLNQISYYAKPYFLFATIAYSLWTFATHKLLRFVKPTYHYDKHILSKFCSVSRFFGSAVIYIIIFDFNNTIDYLLWTNIYIGFGIACLTYISRIARIINMSDFPTKKF